ncbi:hypothetical protein B9Z55_027563 [Caenorhabditis nigoni]|uniref:Uncharacterized protein n=1 Tax=Caenorhabditis nigoni TaxID=1611254 RepID=A0A2G5SF99_9PELO|nr:hypothetical protein B9Z55_027563 [Caenorhabditis nigoni]
MTFSPFFSPNGFIKNNCIHYLSHPDRNIAIGGVKGQGMQFSSVGATKAVRVLQGRNPTQEFLEIELKSKQKKLIDNKQMLKPVIYFLLKHYQFQITLISHNLQKMSTRRPFAELNEYSLPDLERRIITAVLYNELDIAAFLNGLDPLVDNEEVDHNSGDDEDTMDSNELNADATVSGNLELEQNEGEQQYQEEEDG